MNGTTFSDSLEAVQRQMETILGDPAALERLFREAPEAFRCAFPSVYAARPASLMLQAWEARLEHEQDAAPGAAVPRLRDPAGRPPRALLRHGRLPAGAAPRHRGGVLLSAQPRLLRTTCTRLLLPDPARARTRDGGRSRVDRRAWVFINLCASVHLLGTVSHYVRFPQGRTPLADVEGWMAGYLPLYALWAGFISFVYPFLFSLE